MQPIIVSRAIYNYSYPNIMMCILNKVPPTKNKRGRKKKVDTPVMTQGNPNDSEVAYRYPKRSRISKL